MRQPVGARIKLLIREAFLRKHHRKRIRRARRLRRKQPRQARTSNRTPRRVPTPQDAGTLLPPQDVHTAQLSIGLRHHRLRNTDQPPPQRLNRPPLKQVSRVFNRPRYPRRRAVPRTLLAQAQRQVELRRRRRHRHKPRLNPTHRNTRRRSVLQHNHHLKQRMVRKRARRIEHLNKTLKRYIRMAVGREVEGANPPNQIAQPRIARRIRTQHKRVDKAPDKLIQRTVRATRNRAPDRYVLASPKPAQKPGNTSLQQHEQARTTLPRNPNEPRVQLSRQPQPNHLPAMARHRRTSTVARQRYRFRKPRQRLLPVPKLARNRAPRIALIPQNLLLP